MREFVKIQDALSSLGFNVRTVLDSRSHSIIGWRNRKVLREQGIESPEPEIKLPKQLSYEMVEYIWLLAGFRSNTSRTMIATDGSVKINLSDLSKLE
jgi:hypothetical protein